MPGLHCPEVGTIYQPDFYGFAILKVTGSLLKEDGHLDPKRVFLRPVAVKVPTIDYSKKEASAF